MHQLVFLLLSLFLPDATFSTLVGSCNRQCSSTTVPYPPDPNTNTNVRAWAHGFAQQEEKTKGRAYLVMLVVGEGAEVAATAGPVVCGWGVARSPPPAAWPPCRVLAKRRPVPPARARARAPTRQVPCCWPTRGRGREMRRELKAAGRREGEMGMGRQEEKSE